MSWSEWYTAARTAMTTMRGIGSACLADGVKLPLMQPLDSIAVLGQVSGSVVSAITGVSQGRDGRMIYSARVGDNGLVPTESQSIIDVLGGVDAEAKAITAATLGPEGGLRRAPSEANTLDAEHYVAGLPGTPGSQPWKRELPLLAALGGGTPAVDAARTYEPWLYDFNGADTASLNFGYQLMSDWQACVDASANMITLGGANVIGVADADAVSVFWSKLGALCSDLDVMNENPPPTEADKVKAGMEYTYNKVGALADKAASAVGDAAGRLAAKVGEMAGQVGGGFAHGFLSQAGLITAAVCGLAVWWYL